MAKATVKKTITAYKSPVSKTMKTDIRHGDVLLSGVNFYTTGFTFNWGRIFNRVTSLGSHIF